MKFLLIDTNAQEMRLIEAEEVAEAKLVTELQRVDFGMLDRHHDVVYK
jgi:hypothetical protein